MLAGFVEPIDEIKMDMMHLTQPYTIRHWHPDISLTSMIDQERHAFVVDLTQTREDPWRPFHLEMSLPASAANVAFQLHVDDWIRYGFWYPHAHTIARPVLQPFTYSVVFSTFFRNQRQAMVDLMLKHMEYHNVLGFSTHHVYVHGDYLSVLLENSRVLACIQAGSLELIYWDVFGGYATPVWEYADQALMYNHALLMLWGESRRAAFLDVDEYLATPKKTTIAEMYASCFHPGQLQVLRRFDALCSNCTAGASELSMWYSNDVRTALSHYTLLRLDAGGLSLDLGKCIADVDHVHSYFVHDAVLQDDAQSAMVPESCAFLVHLVSLIDPRASPEGFQEAKAWHWFLDP